MAFAFRHEEGTGLKVGSIRWFNPRLGFSYPARYAIVATATFGSNQSIGRYLAQTLSTPFDRRIVLAESFI